VAHRHNCTHLADTPSTNAPPAGYVNVARPKTTVKAVPTTGAGWQFTQDTSRHPLTLSTAAVPVCPSQVLKQYPEAFEFTDAYLLAILHHSRTGWFGTFVGNSEKERIKDMSLPRSSQSLWPFLFAHSKTFQNHSFHPSTGAGSTSASQFPGDPYQPASSANGLAEGLSLRISVSPLFPSVSMRHICLWENLWLAPHRQAFQAGWRRIIHEISASLHRTGRLALIKTGSSMSPRGGNF